MKIIYENKDVMVVDKPTGMITENIPRRVHRLDKETSGLLLIAKNDKVLEFLQKEFQERRVEKKYLALVVGELKNSQGEIRTLLGRSPKDRRKQKVYLLTTQPLAQGENLRGKREAITEYRVLQKFKNYTLIEVKTKTGRKHQIRAHFAHLHHPLAGDKLYGFKNQPCPAGLTRQFLHASELKIKLPNKQIKKFKSKLPEDLKKVLGSFKLKIK